MNEYLVIGPSKAGKTGLLATLYHASLQPAERGEPSVRLLAESEAMEELIEQAQSTLQAGRMPIVSTTKLTEYKFTLVVSTTTMFIRREQRATFTVLDGPGGVLFPDGAEASSFTQAAKEARQRLVEGLRSAQGLMLCLEAGQGDAGPTLTMFRSLPRLLQETRLPALPSDRISICLTKADALFYRFERDAQRRAESTSAYGAAITDVLSKPTVQALRQHFKPAARVAFGWTSVYGFLASGEPNYDADGDCLRVQVTNGNANHAINQWKPFRVLEPFVFLATGTEGKLEIRRAKTLGQS